MGLLALLPFGTSGCFDRQELEQQAFVSVLGLDKAPGNLLDCTFRIAQPSNPSGGGDKGGMEPLAGKEPVTIRARSISEAMVLASGSIERTITFSHLSLIILGADLAKSGVRQYVEPLTRYREFRRTVPVSVSTTTAKDVIDAFQPMLDTSITRIADGIALVSQRSGIAPMCRIQDLMAGMEQPHENAIAPLYGMNQYVSKQEQQLPDKANVDYQPGGVERLGGNPVDWMGAAVFQSDRVVDTITGEDNIYLRLLQGSVRHAMLNLEDPNNPSQPVGIELHKERPATYRVTLGNPVKIRVLLPLDVDVVGIASGIDYSDRRIRMQFQQDLKKQFDQHAEALLDRLLRKDQSDVVPISRAIRGQFSTYAKFADYPWEDHLKTAEISVDSDIHVRRFGVQIESIQKKG
ncbi:Ger(x)C family spore germination protein [Alicyclobacillus acidiphilus]|uniref:Ger(x)C family spore germination protein n=1 Tax=Alicyclobacillus acidiphilus TaxID=182455 RepID=UPI003F911E9D